MKDVLVFLAIFGVLISAHEFGHFIVVKECGILVREFSIGMGSKLFQRMCVKITYTIRWLPLGGYVRLADPDGVAKINPGTAIALQLNK